MNTVKEKLGVIPIKEIAKQTEFEKRTPKKIACEDYVSSFVKCVLKGDISQASWCKELSKEIGELVSEQALQGKVQFRHEEFSKKLLESALEHTSRVNVSHLSCETLCKFTAIKAHDSTCVKMPSWLIDFFPGSSSRNGSNAMARIQLSMDILNNTYCDVAVTSFRKNDQSYAMTIAENTVKGELNLFDLGYFKKELLGQIDEAEAYYVCRYFNVSLFKPSESEHKNEEAIDLVKHLKSLEKQGINHWDSPLEMGRKERIPMRIVATRLPQNIAQARRRKRIKSRAQDNRKAYKEEYLYLLGWNIYFTNVPPSILPAKEIFRIYSLRWRIEIIFKAWKSKFDFTKMFDKQTYGLPSRAIIQINLILFTIVMFLTKYYQELFHLIYQATGRLLSLLKFSNLIKHDLVYLDDLYKNDQRKLIKILAKQYCYDIRKDRLNFIESIYNKKLS